MQVIMPAGNEYEYEFTFNLCNHRYMNKSNVSGWTDAKLHKGINNGSKFQYCVAMETQYRFLYDTSVDPTRLHFYVNSVIENWIINNISDFQINLDGQSQDGSIYGYYRCYKNLKIMLLPPKYKEAELSADCLPKYEAA